MRKYLVACSIFIFVTGIVELILFQEIRRQELIQHRNTLSQAGEIRGILQSELNATLHLATGLVSYIQANKGIIKPDDLSFWLESLIRQGKYIRNIGLAPGNRLTYIYPLEGNEAALGLYYPDLPQQWPAVERTIKERQAKLAGPIELVQGGNGLIYRVPVFLEYDQYWGLVSTVINADHLYDVVRETAAELQLGVILKRDTDIGTQTFFKTGDYPSRAKSSLTIQLPGAVWTMDAFPLGIVSAEQHYRALRIWGAIGSFLISLLVYSFLSAREKHIRVEKDKQHVETRFTSAFEMAPIGMVIVDHELRIESANAAFHHMIKCEPGTLIDKPIMKLISPAFLNKTLAELNASLSQERGPQSWEMTLSNIDGEPVDIMFHMAGLQGKTKGSRKLLLQIHDIRERKRLERMKNQFVSTVSHELRTPITSVSGSLSLLAKTDILDTDPNRARDLIGIAIRNSKRLQLLINDLLDMEKISAGMLSLKIRRLDPSDVLKQAVETLQPFADQYKITIESKLPEQSLHIEADDSRLLQVLANFLSNAIKFSCEGGTVTVALETIEQHARLSVIDHGPGITEGFRERIFNRFSQADSSDSRIKGGTGLGLAISKDLVEKMGGTIGFESEPNVETRFYAEFPLSTEPYSSDDFPLSTEYSSPDGLS
ncbi:hypothetical protein BTA51_06715 [Hahella sp. CCB-MM4]|uniref:ATP-binding protein n=1 Tax=Hahella sp. (strain CCB-MM4) TaxID=1926491 RepID=UPI000B9B5742|nr:ATP-binding protein [Hahella sp. CCB-MM4]OZG74669.1 hypothetical protein BTA51_06715 [Hahella sp. CCB-MM4]